MLKNLFNFKNKIILITGCSGQIGMSVAKLYLSLGSKVYGFDLNKPKIKDKRFTFIEIDISKNLLIQKKISEIFIKEKRIDILINNAGTSVFSSFEERSDSELQKVFEINLKSIINITKNYLIYYKKYKLKSGNIINMGSIYGFLSPEFKIYSKGDRFSPEIYAATKASVIQITKYFAVLFADKNIRVNSISPGGILNKKKQTTKFIKKYSQRVPIKRMGNVEDLMTAFLYLSSDYSKYTTGQNIIIDGGLSLK
jgi:NAD(P)-dependent dehydrogenase (short-subunit alcohol dehydrogenase family)|tara:strand:- start:485 stop:1246 length:762 start_codon:yes stop_codon:yes gene_type:complete